MAAFLLQIPGELSKSGYNAVGLLQKSSLQYDIVNISLYITSMRYIWKHRINS